MAHYFRIHLWAFCPFVTKLGLVYICRLCLLVIWAFCPTTVYRVFHFLCYFFGTGLV